MIVSINQPAYLPWLGYFNRIVKSDIHIILDHVQFEKNSFTNRNKILVQTQPLWLTVPVLTKGNFRQLPIYILKMDPKINWQKKHWLTIQHAYARSPYWFMLKNELQKIYAQEYLFLSDVLRTSFKFFIKNLSIKTPYYYSSDYNFQQNKSDLILEICRKFNATYYLSGPHGRGYLNIQKFQEARIEVIYDDYKHPTYNQQSSRFIPYLSCLDILANCGKNALEILINE